MKRLLCTLLMLTLLAVPLVGCAAEKAADASTQGKTLHGIINKIDDYLVLLTDEGEYQMMDLGEGVTLEGFAEGDSVDVTYTGELGETESTPVVTAIVKAK